jgi:hypothetical protein
MSLPPPGFNEEFLAWFEEESRAQGYEWTGGFKDLEVRAVELQGGFRFPPDYRLFLTTLGAGRAKGKPVGFYDWRTEMPAIQAALDGVAEGILHDVEKNGVWQSDWGLRPTSLEHRRNAILNRIRGAPRLLPLIGHRFLVGTPNEPGNPVLSIVQTDAIVWGANLRTFLLNEIGWGRDHDALGDVPEHVLDEKLRAIDFWGPLVLESSGG